MTLINATFVIERVLKASPARVFQAFTSLGTKSAWFKAPVDVETLNRDFDFRVGGRERFHARWPSGMTSDFQAVFYDIVENERIILVYDLFHNDEKLSVSLQTLEFRAESDGTRLIHTEQGSYFSGGLEAVAGREHGTTWHIDNLVAVIEGREPSAFHMSIELFAHPFSSYCQKALIAFYENDVPFTYRMMEDPGVGEEFASLWPLKRFPIVRENERVVLEASIIIEYLQLHHPGPIKLVPEDADLAVEVRMLDRFFDNYVMTPQGKFVFDAMRPPESKDPFGVEEAGKMLDTSYAWLDARMSGRTWAVGETFTLADCAAAPSLFYADWTHPIPEHYANLVAYRARLLERPSFARAVDEARVYRHYFPLGAPDRD